MIRIGPWGIADRSLRNESDKRVTSKSHDICTSRPQQFGWGLGWGISEDIPFI